jgi:hypothetical protein
LLRTSDKKSHASLAYIPLEYSVSCTPIVLFWYFPRSTHETCLSTKIWILWAVYAPDHRIRVLRCHYIWILFFDTGVCIFLFSIDLESFGFDARCCSWLVLLDSSNRVLQSYSTVNSIFKSPIQLFKHLHTSHTLQETTHKPLWD